MKRRAVAGKRQLYNNTSYREKGEGLNPSFDVILI